MRLTNQIRDAFISGVMRDVPSVDYSEQIRKLLCEDIEAQLPPAVLAIYKDKALCGYVNKSWSSFDTGVSVTYPWSDNITPSITAPTREKVAELGRLSKLQSAARNDLQRKLKNVAYSVTTRKALVQALPEFEKYLPEDEAKAVRTLPVVQNVVADFVKAGWPVSKKGAKC